MKPGARTATQGPFKGPSEMAPWAGKWAALAALIAAALALGSLQDASRSRDDPLFDLFQGKSWWKTSTDAAFLRRLRETRFGIPLEEATARYALEPGIPGEALHSRSSRTDVFTSPSGRMTGLRTVHVLDRNTDPREFSLRVKEALLSLDPRLEFREEPLLLSGACGRAAFARTAVCNGHLVRLSFSGPAVLGTLSIAPNPGDGSVTEAVLLLEESVAGPGAARSQVSSRADPSPSPEDLPSTETPPRAGA